MCLSNCLAVKFRVSEDDRHRIARRFILPYQVTAAGDIANGILLAEEPVVGSQERRERNKTQFPVGAHNDRCTILGQSFLDWRPDSFLQGLENVSERWFVCFSTHRFLIEFDILFYLRSGAQRNPFWFPTRRNDDRAVPR